MAGRQKKDPISSKGHTLRTIRHGGSKFGMDDMTSKMLRQAGKGSGNDTMKQLLKGANGKRDGIVDFILARLKQVRDVQLKESLALQNHGDWYRYAFRNQEGYNLPDPKRWHESTGLYKRAAEAACNGNLGRAVQIMESAMQKEAEAWDTVPEFVSNKLDPWQGSWGSRPEEADNVSEEAQCDARAKPQELVLADRILSLEPTVKPVTAQLKQPHQWWVEEEEEEEEAGGGKAKG